MVYGFWMKVYVVENVPINQNQYGFAAFNEFGKVVETALEYLPLLAKLQMGGYSREDIHVRSWTSLADFGKGGLSAVPTPPSGGCGAV